MMRKEKSKIANDCSVQQGTIQKRKRKNDIGEIWKHSNSVQDNSSSL